MKNVILLLVVIILIFLIIQTFGQSMDRYHGGGIGGGSPGFVSYAIRGGIGPGGCGCGYYPDGRPYCDLTGPISYE